jgi:phosphopantothenoylcysteine decarboxylase/phosphopantothenate--cysteine ligase
VEEPELILDILKNHIKKKLIFKDKSFLITAGPTFEMIDPVRFIGNFSSGKMGYELAKEASRLGAKVHLISGPSNEQINDENIILKRIVSADEMFDECSKVFNDIDVFIMSAAVSDYKPSKKNHNKIKKDKSEKISVQLVKNKDILKSLALKKTKGQKVIGFSLETEDELKNATKKLKNKNLDAIILNSLNDKGAGFNLPTNKISFITSSYLKDFTVKTKKDVAKDILLEVFNL